MRGLSLYLWRLVRVLCPTRGIELFLNICFQESILISKWLSWIIFFFIKLCFHGEFKKYCYDCRLLSFYWLKMPIKIFICTKYYNWLSKMFRGNLYINLACLSVCLFVCIQYTSKRLNRSGPNFLWVITWPQGRFMND